MRVSRFFAPITLIAACVLSCSGGGSLELSADGSKQSFAPSLGISYATTKTFTEPDPKGGFKSAKASSHHLYLTNFAPKSDVRNLREKTSPTANGNVRVSMAFVGPEGSEGSKTDTPIPSGSYGAAAAKFQKVESIEITVFADGKAKEVDLDRDKTTGTVKITSADGESIAGEIDVRDGKSSVKGSFKTKLQKP
ncbi:MAG TPA: hypothetical protein PLI95_03900 [Polyangiaceae bacterium]|nr:hypothetical protein [Polyangiaceae bacterium]